MTTQLQDEVPDQLPVVPVIDKAAMKSLGIALEARFKDYEQDRKAVEDQWLKNLRQFKGIYDPEIISRMVDDMSRAYPKITRTKCIGTIARLMEMLFPETENNWGITPSPLPDLSVADLQMVLDALSQEKTQAAAQTGAPPAPLDNDEIEKAIMSTAKAKSEKMATTMEDQLDELEYIQMARQIIFSAVVYSIGTLKGPMVKKIKSRSWKVDAASGQYTAYELEKLSPYYEAVSVWNYYPDLSAKSFDQVDGEFERHVMSRQQLRDLAARPDFMGDAIRKYLQDHQNGNYRERHWETSLRVKGDRQNLTNLTNRKYEWWEFWGSVSGHDLKRCGVNIPDDQLDMEMQASLCGIDSTLIKAVVHPYDGKIRMYHSFVYEEDDINLLGSGLPTVMRDSQMAICEAARMLLDNASVVCGPILEMNTELMMPGQNLDIYAFKTFLREGTGTDASQQAVRSIQIDSHIGELSEIIKLFMSFADTETALPPPALGDVSGQGKEAYRTSSGTSMLLGAAALPIRDTVRNFDKFTTSFITSLYFWNIKFNTDSSIKGDYTILARGSTSLVAKEVRASTLAQFAVTLTPEERVYVSTKKMLMERMKANDIPMDVLEDDDIVSQKLQEQAATAQAQAKAQSDLQDVEVKQGDAAAFKDVALANAASARTSVDSFNALVQGVTNAHEVDQAGRVQPT